MKSAKLFVKNSIQCQALLGSISGCAKDYSMAPSPGGEQVKIVIRVSEELEVTPLRVMYRSAICEPVTHDRDGRPEKLEGYNSIDVKLSPQNNRGAVLSSL
ncbi:hypothetical protein JN403_16980 [Pseudomonas sp. 15A4]|jgi:23S rRNA A2030 N6-methylase RlmJ|uniref:hypothetical protein n=1 Tax=Pseudomonas sp. 15A4 TaxID=2804761 RepID=UPI00196712A6|nr:hypothetical protein [Pseudomonas sp. 15A4]QSB18242.1 hypothetical protein JN403_16980 [Pseudomonas sp. 15A4]